VAALETYTGKMIAVTGASGFLASRLVARLMSVDCRIIRVSASSALPAPPPGLARVDDLSCDVRHRTSWCEFLSDVDYVFHFAAQTSVYAAAADPEADWHCNVQPMLHLLEICREHNDRPVILFAGTVTQAGIPGRTPVDESVTDRPLTIYDLHKLASEQYLEHYVREGWARGVTLRLSNVYGPGPSSSAPERGVLNRAIRRALDRQPLTLYRGGRRVRDYLFVEDAAAAFLAAGAHLEQIDGRHFVVGSGTGYAMADAFAMVVERVSTLTADDVSINVVDPPTDLASIEDRDFVADSSAFRRATGWSPRTTLTEGIDITAHSFLAAQQLPTCGS